MMNRRTFLQVVGAAAPASLAGATADAAESNEAQASTAKPIVFVREDFHHLSGIAPPLRREDVTKTVDVIAGTGVNTLIFSLGSRGGMCLYDTRVGQMHSTNVDKWTHAVNYRDALHVRQLVKEGWDRPQLFCERCHEEDMLFIASAPINIGADTSDRNRGLGRTSDFVFDNQHLSVGKDNDPRAEHISPTRMNFIHPEVRAERLQIYEEFLSRYETDGVEVQSEVLPICKYNEVERCASLLTEWLRKLKAIALKAEKSQSRKKRIWFRVPADPKDWEAVGFDVAQWIKDGSIDGLLCASSDPEVFDQDLDLTRAVELSEGTPCDVIVDCGMHFAKRRANKPTPELLFGAAANAYDQGAVGFGLNDMVRSQSLSSLGRETHSTLHLLGSPKQLATTSKIYHVRDQPKNLTTHGSGLPSVRPPLPQELLEGREVKISLRIADDLPHWHRLDRVRAARLRVRITNLEPTLNQLKFELNDHELADTTLSITDLNYRFVPEGVAYQGSQIFEFDLQPEHYPNRGLNIVAVTLVRRDPDVNMKFTVDDVDCSIEYRHHRHFDTDPIQY